MKNTVATLQQQKLDGDKITMLTAYDYSTAKLVDECGVNTILVGDSLGMVMLGYEDTISVTMEDMIHHTAAVTRGAKNALVVTDMPFMSYQTSVYDAVVNAGRLIKDIVKAYKQLKDTPLIGSLLDAKINIKTDFRYLVCRGYMIFYKVDGNAVYIYRIINGRRDYCRILFR